MSKLFKIQRLTYMVVPGIIAVGLYLVISNLDPAEVRRDNRLRDVAPDYDGWSEGISTVLYDEDGQIGYTLEADRQVHHTDDSTVLENPVIHVYAQPDNEWNIRADSGRILGQADAGNIAVGSVQLLGDVLITNVNRSGQRMELSTEYLLVDPETERAETDREVYLDAQAIQQSATGMTANMINDEITFLSNVQGSYDPNVQ